MLTLPNISDTSDPVVKRIILVVQELNDRVASNETAIFGQMSKDIREIKGDVRDIKQRMAKVENHLERVENRLEGVETEIKVGFMQTNDILLNISKRMDQMAEHFIAPKQP